MLWFKGPHCPPHNSVLLPLRDGAENLRGGPLRYERTLREGAIAVCLTDGTWDEQSKHRSLVLCARWCQPFPFEAPPFLALTFLHCILPYPLPHPKPCPAERKARDGVRLFDFAQHLLLFKAWRFSRCFCLALLKDKMTAFEFHSPEMVPPLCLQWPWILAHFWLLTGKNLFTQLVERNIR